MLWNDSLWFYTWFLFELHSILDWNLSSDANDVTKHNATISEKMLLSVMTTNEGKLVGYFPAHIPLLSRPISFTTHSFSQEINVCLVKLVHRHEPDTTTVPMLRIISTLSRKHNKNVNVSRDDRVIFMLLDQSTIYTYL